MAIDKVSEFVKNVGRPVANALFPNEFEYYAITVELVDSIGKTVDSLVFPVMPSRIMYDKSSVETIRRTAGGVSVIGHEGFNPAKVTLSGTFGRASRLIIGTGNIVNFFNPQPSGVQQVLQSFDPQIKTGFGVLKTLESIVERSRTLDQANEPHRLFLYNPALGHSFLVRVDRLSMEQDEGSTNMLWQYTLEMTAIAPVTSIGGSLKGTLIEATAFNTLQSKADRLATEFARQT